MTQSCGPGSQASVIGRTMISEKDAESYMKKYKLYDKKEYFPKEIRTMEISEWEAFARKNPYLAKYYNKKMPGYFFIALETWNSELDFDTCNPFVETIFADTVKHWRNLTLDDNKEVSEEAKILLENVGLALGSLPG
ncbi:MAG: hypothetical protein VX984_02665 [Thermodesulfobacteriota bacterium]|nr:hypothetical protein [Thermodesulfobacteriota bacterium]MEE2975317.1 hypothetical protein [Thermodesulfobacteriota bacterium]|tara:strand:+ start:4044 stop:4454 length:411 start_codon:yes stop_codon:yes gene_type:complete